MVLEEDLSYSWFNQLYIRYSPHMIQEAQKVLLNYESAEDVVQEVFMIAWLKQDILRKLEKPSSWLYKVLKNQIGNELQRSKYRKAIPLDDHPELISPDISHGTLSDILPVGLSEQERNLLILFYEEQLSHEEIARQIGKSVCASRTALTRAKKHCKKLWHEK